MASRAKTECFVVICDHLFKVVHLTQLLITNKNRISKVVKGRGTIWVARRTESECFADRGGTLSFLQDFSFLQDGQLLCVKLR